MIREAFHTGVFGVWRECCIRDFGEGDLWGGVCYRPFLLRCSFWGKISFVSGGNVTLYVKIWTRHLSFLLCPIILLYSLCLRVTTGNVMIGLSRLFRMCLSATYMVAKLMHLHNQIINFHVIINCKLQSTFTSWNSINKWCETSWHHERHFLYLLVWKILPIILCRSNFKYWLNMIGL